MSPADPHQFLDPLSIDLNRARSPLSTRFGRTATAEVKLLKARANLRLIGRRAQLGACRLDERETVLKAVYRWCKTTPSRALGSAPHRPARRLRLQPRLLARPDSPTLFIECTNTYHSDLNTGIQRVVRNILRNATVSAAAYGYAVVPVVLKDNRFFPTDLGRVLEDKSRVTASDCDVPTNIADRVRRMAQSSWRRILRALSWMLPFPRVRRFLFAPRDRFGLASCILLPLRLLQRSRSLWGVTGLSGEAIPDKYASCEGSILVLLDASWTFPIWPAVKRFKRRGGKVVGVIYDLVPITHPHTSMPDLTVAFTAWLKEHIRLTEALIGISRSTADQVAQFTTALAERGEIARHPFAIDHFHQRFCNLLWKLWIQKNVILIGLPVDF